MAFQKNKGLRSLALHTDVGQLQAGDSHGRAGGQEGSRSHSRDTSAASPARALTDTSPSVPRADGAARAALPGSPPREPLTPRLRSSQLSPEKPGPGPPPRPPRGRGAAAGRTGPLHRPPTLTQLGARVSARHGPHCRPFSAPAGGPGAGRADFGLSGPAPRGQEAAANGLSGSAPVTAVRCPTAAIALVLRPPHRSCR